MATATASPDFVGIAEIAERFSVSTQLAHKWSMSKRFPAPAQTLRSAGRIWRRGDVEQWAKEHRPDLLRKKKA